MKKKKIDPFADTLKRRLAVVKGGVAITDEGGGVGGGKNSPRQERNQQLRMSEVPLRSWPNLGPKKNQPNEQVRFIFPPRDTRVDV